MRGVIKNIVEDRGFGFITSPDFRDDVFFHHTQLLDLPFDERLVGRTVEFLPTVVDGRNRAINVANGE